VASKGFPWDEFKLLSTFPRRDVSSLPVSKNAFSSWVPEKGSYEKLSGVGYCKIPTSPSWFPSLAYGDWVSQASRYFQKPMLKIRS
jgi:hypothetical protein